VLQCVCVCVYICICIFMYGHDASERVLQRVLQCFVVCCSVLSCVAVCVCVYIYGRDVSESMVCMSSVCCSVLQFVAVCLCIHNIHTCKCKYIVHIYTVMTRQRARSACCLCDLCLGQ